MLNISELLSAFKLGMIALEGADDASHYRTSGEVQRELDEGGQGDDQSDSQAAQGFQARRLQRDYSGKWPRKVPHQPVKPFRGGRGGGFAGGKCYVCYMPGHKAEVCPNRK